MSLEEYIEKRKFDSTPEPIGEIDHENGGRFVVQRHQATKLHYDLRLEIQGVLKSWAIPKGPSLNPKDKRLAIHTEDHPVKYLYFKGIIPKGNYGAGIMDIWDHGTFKILEPKKYGDAIDQHLNGNMKISLSGSKLKGEFSLVKMSNAQDNHWLLIKKKDRYATNLTYDSETFVEPKTIKKETKQVIEITPKEFIKPMLASSAKKIFNDPNWIYELKYDGYRMVSSIIENKVTLYSRNGILYNTKFKTIRKELEEIPHSAILDGEIVVVDENGIPDFQKLQHYDPATTRGTLQYFVFDLLFLNGHSTLELSLIERKSLLPDVLEGLDNVIYCDHVEGMGAAFYKKAIDAGLEGVMAKKSSSIYTPGYRTEDWLKIKAFESEEFLICGYTDSVSGGSIFGSLILGAYRDGALSYVGNCGSGFSSTIQKDLLNKLKGFKSDQSPFDSKINLKGRKANWVTPELICEVKYSGWTDKGILRHAVYKGLREDKTLVEISQGKTQDNTLETLSTSDTKASESSLLVDGIHVPISNIDKVYWPESGLTKYDLIDYYIKVSETILPYLVDRPESLHRHPNGIDMDSFFQKDNEHLPSWIETFEIYSKSGEREIKYLLCQNEATLLYMANLGCIELNPWNSRVKNIDNPDYTVIDLDPSDKNTFDQVIETAQVVREILEAIKIEGYCKTSGSRGLHIYLPLAGSYNYEQARNFTKLICLYVQEKLPKLTSLERSIKKRGKKIYLDFMQNKRGQTLAAPYCVRPRTTAPVSTPLLWEEVKMGLKLTDFNIHTVPDRIKSKGDLFSGVLDSKIDMVEAIERLDQL